MTRKKLWKRVNDRFFKGDKSVISELTIEDEPCSGALLANKFNGHFPRAGVSMASVDGNGSYTSYVTDIVASCVFYAPDNGIWNIHTISENKNITVHAA